MFPEDAILLTEIVDPIFLVAIYPASNGEHEELHRMGHRQRLLGRETQHRIARGDSPGRGRFFAPYATDDSFTLVEKQTRPATTILYGDVTTVEKGRSEWAKLAIFVGAAFGVLAAVMAIAITAAGGV